MTDYNCAVVNRDTNRRTKGIGIFKLSSKKLNPEWRKEWLNEITKTRTVDAHFKNKIENDTVYTCERHFVKDVEICKYLNYFCCMTLGAKAEFSSVTKTSHYNVCRQLL